MRDLCNGVDESRAVDPCPRQRQGLCHPWGLRIRPGGARRKQRDNQRAAQCILPRESETTRVVAQETHYILKKAQLWALSGLSQGHYICRVVQLKDIFFYHEYIFEFPADIPKHKRQPESMKII